MRLAYACRSVLRGIIRQSGEGPSATSSHPQDVGGLGVNRPLRVVPLAFLLLAMGLAGFLLFSETASAAIAFDAASSGVAAGVSPFSWSHTTVSTTDGLIVVGVSLRQASGATTVTSVTYGGLSLTFIRAETITGSARSELWYRIGTLSGTQTVEVTLSANERAVGGAVSFTGADQTSPIGNQAGTTGTSTNPSIAIASATGEIVLDTVSEGDSRVCTVGAGQSERWNLNDGGGAGGARGCGSTESGAASVTMNWTFPESVPWSISAVSLRPAPAASCDAITVTTSDPAGQLWFNETIEPDGIPFTTQVNVSASFQDGTTPALSVTNDGSATCDITLRLMSDPGTGRSLKFNTTNNAPWPSDASKEVPLDPSSVTVCTSVAPAGTCDIWLWADFQNALGGQSLADVRVESV